MNPTSLVVSSYGMASQVAGAAAIEANAEHAASVGFDIEAFIFISNIGVFVVTAWLAWVTYMSVREARRAAHDQAKLDDAQQERLTDALSEALHREQNAAHGDAALTEDDVQ